ncbi:CDP-glycerol glycerophosphotransferase family protein [Proteus mirabilis]|uniref:CDP-glycerol glycerophosphotransferase family protein n=1 Tax=Proteus mirabilis TaxID=584 RepID=UPI001F04BBE3|nr:CDP-glycerol glycerophosphotransferase family protein [Proteus mirabilis]
MNITNNKHKYTILRITELVKGYLFWLLSFFIKKDNNIVIINSILNKEFTDNSKALFEYLVKKEEIKTYFIINDDILREKLSLIYPNRIITNKKIKDIFLILKSKTWFCSTMELPLSGFLYRKQRRVIHLGHGMPYKKAGLLEENIKWYKKLYFTLVTSNFSFSIATTDFFKPIIANIYGLPASRVKILPQPKTALLATEYQLAITDLNIDNYNILYAPTWRPYDTVKIFPFYDLNTNDLLKYLAQKNITIWLRLHPDFEENIPNELLIHDNIKLFSSKDYTDVNRYLQSFDCLITDYSSLYFDFIHLIKPVLFFDYDIEIYRDKVGLINDYDKIKSGPSVNSMTEFFSYLDKLKSDSYDLLKNTTEIDKICNFSINKNEIYKFLYKELFKN